MDAASRQSRAANAGPGTNPSRAARITPRGRGAVATVRLIAANQLLDADLPLFRAANGRPVSRQHVNQVAFGQFGLESTEDVVLCRIDEETTELHCHGGDAAVDRVMRDLHERGVLIEDSLDLERRHNGLFSTECAAALARAGTLRTADILLTQSTGRLKSAIEQLLTSPADAPHTAAQLDNLCRWTHFGLRLSSSWQVGVVGRPNVGKSSLINALVGYQRSIVFDQPGTTRDLVTVETAFDGWPVQLADTAGFRDQAGHLEALGIERARQYLAAADLVLLVLDASGFLTDDDRRLLHEFPKAVVVANKCDLSNSAVVLEGVTAIPVSARTGEGVRGLMATVISQMIPETPPLDTALPVSTRQATLLARAQTSLAAGDVGQMQQALREILAPEETDPQFGPPPGRGGPAPGVAVARGTPT